MDMIDASMAEALLYGALAGPRKPLPQDEWDQWVIETATSLLARRGLTKTAPTPEIPINTSPPQDPELPKARWAKAIAKGDGKNYIKEDSLACINHIIEAGWWKRTLRTKEIEHWLLKYKRSLTLKDGRPKTYSENSAETEAATIGTYLERVGIFLPVNSTRGSRSWKVNVVQAKPAQQVLPLDQGPSNQMPKPSDTLRELFRAKFKDSHEIARAEVAQFILSLPRFAYLKDQPSKRISATVSGLMVPMVNQGELETNLAEDGSFIYTWKKPIAA